MELGNILHPENYTSTGLTVTERMKLIEGRSIARHFRQWISSHYQVLDDGDQVYDIDTDVYWPYLASQTSALLHYKYLMEARKETISPIRPQSIEFNIAACFSGSTQFYQHYDALVGDRPLTFSWSGRNFRVRARSVPVPRTGGYFTTIAL